MPAKLKKKYNIKSEEFIAWVISCIGSAPPNDVLWMLDEHEKVAIQNPLVFARSAPLEEIFVIMNKLGFHRYIWLRCRGYKIRPIESF